MSVVDSIKKVCSVEDAVGGAHKLPRLKNNAHVHLPPNFSAFDSIEQVVDLAKEQDIAVLGVTNYYFHDVYTKYSDLAMSAGVFPLFGLEIISQVDDLKEKGVRINDPGNPGRMYICGKGITGFEELTPRAAELMEIIRSADKERMRLMTSELSKVISERGPDVDITDDDVVDMVAKRHNSDKSKIIVQERHVAQAFQEAVFSKVDTASRASCLSELLGVDYTSDPDDAVGVQGDIRTHLMKAGKPAFVVENFVSFEEACELILEMGGIPCYPTLADGSKVPCGFEEDIDAFVTELVDRNIHCAEFIPIRNSPEVLSEYVAKMRAAGLVVVAGTEHNTLDLLPLDPKCVGGAEVPDEIKDIFWEGSCVVAAHEFLVANGKCGFVDSQGNPNHEYADAEDRISAFKKIGENVIAQYRAG